jgi:glycosyltransferase involved in cell wall biosynthesis
MTNQNGTSAGGRVPYVGAVLENPIQYHSPLFAHLAKDPRLRLKVLYLTDRGVRPFGFHGVTVKHDDSVLQGYDWKLLENKSPWKNTFGFLDNFDPEICQAVSEFDAVWIHGYNYASHWLAFAGCRARGIPILLRGESESVIPRPLSTRIIKRPILHSLFSQVTAFLDIGIHNRNYYKSYGIPDERLFRVPYGVDNEWIRGGPGDQSRWRAEIRSELGLGENTLAFIYTSKHRNPKRPLDAVRAFCQVPADPDTVLLMLGDGDLRADAEECYRTNGKGHRIMFLGLRPYADLRRFLAAADVLAFPSIEPWGMAVSEALPAGLAVISTDLVVGSIDMVIPGENGFIYTAGNIDQLAECFRKMIADRDMVARMRAASMRHAENFSFEVAANGLVDAVRFAVKQGRAV